MINKVKTFFLIFTAVLFLGSPVQAIAATLTLSPSSGQINQGCTFPVDIVLDSGGVQTDGTDVILFYEPTKLSANVNSIVNGKIYSDYPGNSVDQSAGKISISGISSVSPFNGKGTLATINFTVLGSSSSGGSSTLRFDFDPNDKTKTTDTNVVERGTIADVLSQVTDGSYTLGTGNCGSSVNASPAPGSPGGGASSLLPQGGGLDSSSSSTVRPTSLPQGGILDTTVVLVTVGTLLVLLGLAGLTLL